MRNLPLNMDNNIKFGYMKIFDCEEYGKRLEEWEKSNDLFGVASDHRKSDKPFVYSVGNHYDTFCYNDLKWFDCNYKDCNFGQTDENLIISHVRQHIIGCHRTVDNQLKKSNINKRVIKKNVDLSGEKMAINTRQSLRLKLKNDLAKQVTDRRNGDEIKSNKKTKKRVDSVFARVFKANSVAQYREKIVADGKDWHCCKWNGCEYKSNIGSHLLLHIYIKHIGLKEFKCSHTNCDKVFANRSHLVEHEKNHKCGYRIDANQYKRGDGVCSYDNINKYYERVVFSYKCLWSGCSKVLSTSQSAERHIHSQHVCPHRKSM